MVVVFITETRPLMGQIYINLAPKYMAFHIITVTITSSSWNSLDHDSPQLGARATPWYGVQPHSSDGYPCGLFWSASTFYDIWAQNRHRLHPPYARSPYLIAPNSNLAQAGRPRQ